MPTAADPDVLLVGHGRTLAAVKWSATDPDMMTLSSVVMATVDANKRNRFNDGKCDPQGRVWSGKRMRTFERLVKIVAYMCSILHFKSNILNNSS